MNTLTALAWKYGQLTGILTSGRKKSCSLWISTSVMSAYTRFTGTYEEFVNSSTMTRLLGSKIHTSKHDEKQQLIATIFTDHIPYTIRWDFLELLLQMRWCIFSRSDPYPTRRIACKRSPSISTKEDQEELSQDGQYRRIYQTARTHHRQSTKNSWVVLSFFSG